MLARRQDDHDLGAERRRDIGAPVESLLAEGRIDCSRERVPRARDPLEHLGGVRPLVRAVVGDRRDVGERVRRGERRRLRDLGGARLGARAPGDERDDGEEPEDGKDAPHDEKYRPVTAEPQSASGDDQSEATEPSGIRLASAIARAAGFAILSRLGRGIPASIQWSISWNSSSIRTSEATFFRTLPCA